MTPSQANFVWCRRADRPVKPIYEELKRRMILVRYMNYEGYGDGLRITVGTDAEIDRLLEELGRYHLGQRRTAMPKRAEARRPDSRATGMHVDPSAGEDVPGRPLHIAAIPLLPDPGAAVYRLRAYCTAVRERVE